MSVKVSKSELTKLHNAAYGSGNYHLKLSKNGIDVPVPLTKAQEKKIGSGSKSVILTRRQLNSMKSGGVLPLIPLAIGLISNLFKGKGIHDSTFTEQGSVKHHEQGGSADGASVDGGFMWELLPLVKQIFGAVKGKGAEVDGGVIEVIGKVLKSIFGKAIEMVPEEQRGGFIQAILKDTMSNAPQGIFNYLNGEGAPKKVKSTRKKKMDF